jgi:hypothetical protein
MMMNPLSQSIAAQFVTGRSQVALAAWAAASQAGGRETAAAKPSGLADAVRRAAKFLPLAALYARKL